MKGHGSKTTQKMEHAILALLSTASIGEAASMAGISETTLWRWLQQSEFQERYKAAKRTAFEQALSQLQAAATEAVATLRSVAVSKLAPPSSRVTAAKAILELSVKVIEIEDLQQRLEKLEAAVKEKGA